MQTTLLGLAMAMILALVTALVGPHFVDWDGFRDSIEAEATRAVGTPVAVTGPIDVRLLPNPSLELKSVALATGGVRMSARGMRVELALGALMRGQWRISELSLDSPQLDLALDAAGRVRGGALPSGFDPDVLSVERLVVENGRAVLTDPNAGGTVTLDTVSFKGDLRSLAGPLRGEGAFVAGGRVYGVRVGAGRAGADGGVRLRLNIDPLDQPVAIETDGTLWLVGAPRYEGNLVLSRPPGAALGAAAGRDRAPWRVAGKVEATSSRVKLAQAEVTYGAEERAVRLAGSADLVLGRFPRLDLSVVGRHVDLDRLDGAAPAAAWPQAAGPAALPDVLRRLAGAIAPPLPVAATVEVDQLVAGGTVYQTLRGRLATTAEGITLDGVELRLPGLTQLRLAGMLRPSGPDLAFAGPVSLESNDPRALGAWIEGRADTGKDRPLGVLRAKGDVALDRDRIAADGLSVTIDRRTVEGRIAYTRAAAGRPSRLEADVRSAEVDLDGAVALVGEAFAGSRIGWPGEATIGVAAGKVAWGRLAAERVEARVGYGKDGLTIERLAVGDLRGATLTGAGRIDTSITAPQGAVTLDVKAPRTDALLGLLDEVAPEQARALRRYAAALGAAELRARLDVAPALHDPAAPNAKRSTASLSVDGRLGTIRLALSAGATGDPADPTKAQVRLDGTVEAKEGAALAALTGLDRLVALDQRPATVALSGAGRLDGEVTGRLDVASGGLWVSATGNGRREADGPSGRAEVTVTAADARVLVPAGAGPVPLSLHTRLTLSGPDLRLDDLAGRLAGASLKGHLGVHLAEPRAVTGRIATSDLDVAPLVAALAGAARRPVPTARDAGGRDAPPRDAAPWSAEPFGRPGFADLFGRVEVEADRATLLPGLVARDLRTAVRFDGYAVAVEEARGRLADGGLSFDAELRQVPMGLSLRTRLALADADLSALVLGSGKAPPATGRVSVSAELDGIGLSPAALVGALHGSGAVTVTDVQLAGLDPKAVDAGIAAVERGLPLERLAGWLGPALEGGRLTVAKAGGAVSVVDGRVRLGPMETTADGTDVTLTAAFDLAADALDARITLTGPGREDAPGGRRPELGIALRGPWAAPKRSVDTNALVTWVTLRTVEQEAKRLEIAEREAKRREALAEAERARLEKDRQERAERERLAREAAARERVAREARDAAAREAAAREAAARDAAAREAAARPVVGRPEAPRLDGDPASTASAPPRGPASTSGLSPRPAPSATVQPSAPAPGSTASAAPPRQAGESPPALPPPIEIRSQPVVRSAAPAGDAGAGMAGQASAGPPAAARPSRPSNAQAQPQPEAPSPVRSLMKQLFNFQ
ncbi:AsmA family protein [Rhodoplanes azumiensis]|uniref:AsmA family protein n=1 Tax=Rhodoplanes azumiensis TaxID=1897628 RepID=A0ABW5AI70_9BRAD